MSSFSTFQSHDLKGIYRVLHAHLLEHPQLLDSDFLQELQTFLQGLALLEGVDVSDHGQWDAWLGGETRRACRLSAS